MAVVDNAGADLGATATIRNFEPVMPDSNGNSDADHHHHHHPSHLSRRMLDPNLQQNAILRSPSSHDQSSFQMKVQQLQQRPPAHGVEQGGATKAGMGPRNGEGFQRDMRDLEELLSKLNPMAEEFIPPSLIGLGSPPPGGFYYNNFGNPNSVGGGNGNNRRKKNYYSQGKRRINSRTSMAQREEVIRRTVYVSDIDQQVTEEQLAALFINCGQVVDCRVCGDPNSVLRFAFIEFTDEEGARAALSLAGTMLGYYPVRVLPSKTAIAPVNPTFLPRSEDEREMCARTIYCTNIDKKVTQAEIKLFFETVCGEVQRLRLLGDYHHSTRIAFVEFVMLWCAAYKPQPTKDEDSACVMDVDSLEDEVRSLKKKCIVLCIMEVDLPANHLQFQECLAG